MKGERGGITMFALVTLSGLLLAAFVLSDLLRANLAAAEAESEARSAARSLLSGFDTDLLEYGLFGADWDADNGLPAGLGTAAAKRRAASGGSFRWFDTPDSRIVRADPLYDLGDHRVFQDQVLERMKYVAPIEFGVEVVQKFSKGKTAIQEAKRTAEMTKELGKAWREREDALDSAWTFASRIASSAGTQTAGGSLQPELNVLSAYLADAKKANQEMQQMLAVDGSGTEPAPVSIYPSEYFSEYEAGAAAIASMHGTWVAAVQAAEKAEDTEETEEEADSEEDQEGVRGPDVLLAELQQAAAAWYNRRQSLENERRREREDAERAERNGKTEAEAELSRGRMGAISACAGDSSSVYDELAGNGGLYEKYRTYNAHLHSGGIESGMDESGVEAFLTSSLNLLEAVMQALEGLRDEAYVNEYVLTHFTYLTLNDESGQFVPGGSVGAHPLRNLEAEYILYGLPSCGLNMAAVHAELFAFRTALRTLEAMLKPGAMARAVHPVAALLTALAEGASRGAADVTALSEGKSVELPFVKGIKVNYKDHLRLFYLLHSRNESVFSRIQAVIELNTGSDLTKRYTAMRVEAEAVPAGTILTLSPVRREAVISY